MHSTVSQPNTSMMRARWTLARIPRLLATYEFGTPTPAQGSCKPCAARPRSIAAHFFPHTRPPDTDTDTHRKLQEKLAQQKVRSVAGLPKDSKLNAYSPLTADALGPSIVSLNTNKSSSSSSSSSSHAPRALTRRIFVSDRLLDGVCTGVH